MPEQTRLIDAEMLALAYNCLETGVIIFALDDRIVSWNHATTRLLGRGIDEEVEPHAWPEYYGIHTSERGELVRWEDLPSTLALHHGRRIERDIFFRNQGIPEGRWIHNSAEPLKDDSGRTLGALVALQDVTQARSARQAQQLYSWFVRSSADAVIGFDPDSSITMWNPGAQRIFGWSTEEILGQSVNLLFPNIQDDIPRWLELMGGGEEVEPARCLARHKDGSALLLYRSLTPTGVDLGELDGAVLVARDLSHVIQAERELAASREQIRQLSQRQQTLLEQQLRQLARELHDELGQQMTAMKLEVAWLERRLSTDHTEMDDHLDRLNRQLDSSISSLRRVSKQMRPPLLEELGLCNALEELMSRTGELGNLQVHSDCPPRMRVLDEDAALAIYRIAQEALTNVVRHACATRVSLRLSMSDERVTLTLQDDGKGLPSSPAPADAHFGILGMKERALAWRGHLEVDNAPDGGVRIVGAWPLANLLPRKPRPLR